ncbi:MAG: excinuclease ABC subunit UvrC [Christensenellales bacterium]
MRKDIYLRIKEKVYALPGDPGVYKMLDMYGNIIYIGKAKNLKNRVSSYFLNTVKLPKVQQMVDNVYDFEYIITLSELEALNLESNLIHKHQPFYNILLKDGKAFPYIRIDYKSDYPMVQVTRKIKNDKAMYFGPFFNKVNVTDLMKIINNTFKLRDCNLNINKKYNRECLNYHINNCLAPCTGRCTKEEYRREVDNVIEFLKGDLTKAKSILTKKMQVYAEMEMFERAIEIRDNLKLIENIDAQNVTGLNKNADIDIFGFAENGNSAVVTVACIRGNKMIGVNNYNVIDASIEPSDIMSNFITQYYLNQHICPKVVVTEYNSDALDEWLDKTAGHKINLISGKRPPYSRLLEMVNKNASEYLIKSIEKNKLYELKTIGAINTLQKTLGLSKLPRRIEGYDISNLGGTNTVASMVVFTGGVKDSKMYRKFKIEGMGQNDFKNMHDVLTRRLNEYKLNKDISFSTLPDLILIDGGIIQLTFAKQALDELGFNIEIISLAKKEEEIYRIDGTKVVLSRDNFALKLLQNVRDESHRFAITFQKSLRQKKTLQSELENIPLIGKSKVTILFDKFKNIESIKGATLEELKSTKGIGEILAKNIFEYFHKASN